MVICQENSKFPCYYRIVIHGCNKDVFSIHCSQNNTTLPSHMDKDFNIDIKQVICDFLELGHVENIVAMFKQDRSLYSLTGDLLRDERFAVRLGTAVLFEELAVIRPQDISLAIPSLQPLLQEKNPLLRGEAATILGIIGTKDALEHLIKLTDDPDFQVREIITDILQPAPGKSEAEFFSGNEESS